MIVRRGLLILAAALAVASGPATARSAEEGGRYALADDERNLKFGGIPIPGYSEVLGANLGLVGVAYYKTDRHDDALPPSATGVFGFYSANNSWIGAAFQKLHLAGDDWRILAGAGLGAVEYQFNPASVGPGLPDVFLDYTTVTDFAALQVKRRTVGRLYAGLTAVTWSARVSLGDFEFSAADERYTCLGPALEWDRRDHVQYPTAGFMVTGRWMVYDEAFGSDRDFRKLAVEASGYHALGDSTRVLAGRILHNGAFGDVPFSAESIVNGNRNLRGYSNGRYRADHLLAIETEYRWNFHGRWGAVAFAGLGWCADGLDRMALDDTLPSAGLGLRWRMIEAYRINARIDYGWGRDDQAVYFAVGEAY